MKRIYELEVYKIAEELSDMVWYDFEKWDKKVQNFYFLISNRERLHRIVDKF